MLLLRALYEKLYKSRSEETRKLIDNVESCLWNQNDISGKADYTKPKLKSEVAIVSDCEILESILSDELLGKTDEIAKLKTNKSHYAENFLFFLEKSDEFAKDFPSEWEKLCNSILKECVILPIECDNQENALRIFNTLNNRGLPLSDSDIFKGIIFAEKKTSEERQAFAREWKELENDLREAKLETDLIFNNYMHIIRARNGEKDNLIGLRKFFTEKNPDILKSPSAFEDIKRLVEYWCGEFDEKYSLKSLQFYDILNCIPNDMWKYLDSAYYFYHKCNPDYLGSKEWENFLVKMTANLLVKLIEQPSVSAIKPIIFNAYTSLYKDNILDFKSDARQILDNKDFFKQQFFNALRLTPSLLCLNLYLKYPEQKIILGEIEHIFPRKWRQGFKEWNHEEAEVYIESIGNKMWLEKKLNIQASNDYFDNKKVEYKDSAFLEAQEIAKNPKNDWQKEDIEARNEEIFERLYHFFQENI